MATGFALRKYLVRIGPTVHGKLEAQVLLLFLFFALTCVMKSHLKRLKSQNSCQYPHLEFSVYFLFTSIIQTCKEKISVSFPRNSFQKRSGIRGQGIYSSKHPHNTFEIILLKWSQKIYLNSTSSVSISIVLKGVRRHYMLQLNPDNVFVEKYIVKKCSVNISVKLF